MAAVSQQLATKWERLTGDEEIDVVHYMTGLTLDTLGLCGFDYRFHSFYRRDYHPFVESLVRSLETIMMTRGIPLGLGWAVGPFVTSIPKESLTFTLETTRDRLAKK